jgi:hypothetical protein
MITTSYRDVHRFYQLNRTQDRNKKTVGLQRFLGFIGWAESLTNSPETRMDKGDFTDSSGIMPTWRDFRPH